jgi:hypothetical protein
MRLHDSADASLSSPRQNAVLGIAAAEVLRLLLGLHVLGELIDALNDELSQTLGGDLSLVGELALPCQSLRHRMGEEAGPSLTSSSAS